MINFVCLKSVFWTAVWLLLSSVIWIESAQGSVRKLSDYRDGVASCASAHDTVLGTSYKKRPEIPVNNSEFNALVASGVEVIGLSGVNHFYSAQMKTIVGIGQVYLMQLGHDVRDASVYSNPQVMAKLQSVSIDNIDGDIPVLCTEQARTKATIAYEKTCELCALAGGRYLQAIYEGDFNKQDTLAREYLNQMAASGGDEAMAVGMIISSLAAKGKDFTYLEDAVGYYLLATSRTWPKQCYGPGSTEVVFTTTYPEQVYETLDGLYLGSDAAVQNVTRYNIKPEFDAACRSMCNKNGGILLTARIAGTSSALEVYKGISQLLNKHDCDSEVIQQFERNLLAMWGQEKAQSRSVRRNSIGNYWRQ